MKEFNVITTVKMETFNNWKEVENFYNVNIEIINGVAETVCMDEYVDDEFKIKLIPNLDNWIILGISKMNKINSFFIEFKNENGLKITVLNNLEEAIVCYNSTIKHLKEILAEDKEEEENENE